MLRVLVWIVIGAGIAVLAASFAGALHPLGDSLAVFRLHLSLACLGLGAMALALHRRAGIGILALSAAALATVLWPGVAPRQATAGPWSVYQKNLLVRNPDLGPLLADIRAAAPDVLTLQEVQPKHAVLLEQLADGMPSQLICPFARVGAVALASRWPTLPGGALCLERQGLAALRLDTPAGPIWAVSLHLHWPWPHGQADQLAGLLPELRALDGPVLIGGDFNMVPWSHAMRAITRATETRRIGRAFNSMTRFWPPVPLAIDHVLVPEGADGTTERRPLLGSDHHGILARFAPPGISQSN